MGGVIGEKVGMGRDGPELDPPESTNPATGLIPIFPSVSKFHPNLSYPIYIPSEAHQPVKRRGRR